MKKFFGIIRYEYRMSIRRWELWLGFGLAFLPYAFRILTSDFGVESFAGQNRLVWQHAGQTAFMLNLFMPLVAGIIIADRLVRDRQLGVEELLHSAPLSRRSYILGKYLGALLSGLTPALLALLVLAIYSAVAGAAPAVVPASLLAFLAIMAPAFAFITAFSLACPLVIPLRVYQVLFTGYWFWGNYLNPSVFPTISGTILTPAGRYALEGFFGGVVDTSSELLRHTPTEAALNLAVLALCTAAALAVLDRFLAWRARNA